MLLVIELVYVNIIETFRNSCALANMEWMTSSTSSTYTFILLR
ncbi:hypothetical protein T08_10623 [Trichinella sp. T8]|nr:hypothetical protein T08_10623 [Trichinella sp. T8]